MACVMEIDESRDEVRLGWPVARRFAGRFKFSDDAATGRGPFPVDTGATNEELVLSGHHLGNFKAISPGDTHVIQARAVVSGGYEIEASRIVVLMLCGGMSFRTQGSIHPLMPFPDPREPRNTKTLLDWQLDRLSDSPLAASECLIAATPLNEDSLRRHLEKRRSARRVGMSIGGLAPRLAPAQPATGEPLVIREPSGQISYNPIGHMEALRWFVLHGLLGEFLDRLIVMIVSYSNWGRVFDATTVRIAGYAASVFDASDAAILLAEVTNREVDVEPGSMLVTGKSNSDDLRLVKYSYGRGRPRFPNSSHILMSTNTLYFSVRNLLARLKTAAPAAGMPADEIAVAGLLRSAAQTHSRDQLSKIFDAAFPVEPFLIPAPAATAPDFLRVERDLDQLTLMPGPAVMRPVEVDPDRGVFMKTPADFGNPEKLAFMFDS